MVERIRLCERQEIDNGGVQRFEVGGRRIAVVRIEDDFYAIGDTCSHEDYSLSEGQVFAEECELECWKHGSTFDLRTGEPRSLPATKPVPVYRVLVEGDVVMLELQ